MLGLVFVVVLFFFVMNIFFRVGFVVVERVLYFFSIGFCFFIVFGFILLSKFLLGKKVSKGFILDIWSFFCV